VTHPFLGVPDSPAINYWADMSKLSPATCRAARALLGWTQPRLAAESGVSVAAIRNFERGSTHSFMPRNLAAVEAALETGVEFCVKADGRIGVVRRAEAK
jgi:transcriptional regulator with XRE-family HTH domain